MFCWMKSDMSKAEILRGIVTEKLTTAAQEILAVVERTVAGYEEEASGFRREIDRQRRQLELLQPQVKLDRRVEALEPNGDEVHSASVEEEDGARRQQHAAEDTGSLGLDLWFDDDDVPPPASSRQTREDRKDPDYHTASRARSDRRPPATSEELPALSTQGDAAQRPPSGPDAVPADDGSTSTREPGKRRRGRPRLGEEPSHHCFKLYMLEDAQLGVASTDVVRVKSSMQEVTCPRGLQEADFLDLLRATFPQLAGVHRPLEVFKADRGRRLQKLRVKTLTPAEIHRSAKATGARNTALYIRIKAGAEPPATGEELPAPPARGDAAQRPPSGPDAVPADDGSTSTREPGKRRRGRPRLGEEPSHHCFKLYMLEDAQLGVASTDVVRVKSSMQEVTCPRGLQEADFLDLLRATFPQLAGVDRPLEVFKADRGRRLQKLRVKTLTPAEIHRSAKATGARNTALYIRIKTGDGEDDEELCLPPRVDAAAEDRRSTDGRRLESSSCTQDHSRTGVEEADDGADSEEEEEQGGDDDDWKPDPKVLPARRGPRAVVLERSKTPCRVCGVWYRLLGSLIKHAWSHADEAACVCGVCGERFPSAEEVKAHLRSYQKTHDCSYCGKSFFTVAGLGSHTTLHTGQRPFRCDVCHKGFARPSSLSVHRWVHVADKPHKCEACPRAFGLKAQLRAHGKVHTGRDKYQCNICTKSFYDLRSLTRHKATHSGERRHGCGVCGKRFKLLGTLRAHEKIHTARERPFLCHVCCKTFVTNAGLTAHLRTHSGARPFVCTACGKGFVSNGELRAHGRVHTDEAPHGCSECGRRFKRKTHLNNHIRSHLGIKLFVCTVCGKACSRQEHLTVHMRTHNGERPYSCTLCDRAFTQSHCLKTHMKSHRAAGQPSAS